ncbi:MAG: hypothetical protein FJ399_21045, partial [Verrucomicrobia bacterium]|nr:hypothetical protein [Verrucomicrobiota bacterium]
MSLRQYAEGKKLGRIRADVETPHIVWRHSFASYLLAKTKSLPTVGYLMQHRHTTTTEIYEGVAKEADAGGGDGGRAGLLLRQLRRGLRGRQYTDAWQEFGRIVREVP